MLTHPTKRLLATLFPVLVALLAALAAPAHAAAVAGPAGAPEMDRDHDGIDDALEDALLARHAPVVLLAPGEAAKPANVGWLLARAKIEVPRPGGQGVLAASLIAPFGALLFPDLDVPEAHVRPANAARHGSDSPRDWIAYGHAYRGADGGILLAYWFFYPFNDGHWAFDHDGDWEHVTVKLSPDGRPLGVWYAQHLDTNPGVWVPWAELSREGARPVVLSARGTHASYASPGSAPFWETVCDAGTAPGAADAGCAVWRTADAGIVNMGERTAPRIAFLGWAGRWGATGMFGREHAADAPPGPAFQRGWCAEGAPGACP